MDGISAGDIPGVFSTSASMSTDGATVTLSTVGTIGGSSTGGGSTGATQQPGIFKTGGVFAGFNVTGAVPGPPVPPGIMQTSLPGLPPR
jgi:hypothetical protein